MPDTRPRPRATRFNSEQGLHKTLPKNVLSTPKRGEKVARRMSISAAPSSYSPRRLEASKELEDIKKQLKPNEFAVLVRTPVLRLPPVA